MKFHLRPLFSIFLLLASCSPSGSTTNSIFTVGLSSRDLLSSATYTKLSIEIQSVSGYAPSTSAQNQLVSFLQARLNKPAGIQIVNTTLSSPGKSSFSISDVRAIEAANRQRQSSGAEFAAYFLFLDGTSSEDSGSSQILGQAYGPSSMVLYEKTIQSLSGSLGQPTRAVLETTVLEHEFGHILGLVNTGSPLTRAHQDSAHGAHCSNTSCLMNWTVETSDVLGNLLGGAVPSLDSDCLADLQANGGK